MGAFSRWLRGLDSDEEILRLLRQIKATPDTWKWEDTRNRLIAYFKHRGTVPPLVLDAFREISPASYLHDYDRMRYHLGEIPANASRRSAIGTIGKAVAVGALASAGAGTLLSLSGAEAFSRELARRASGLPENLHAGLAIFIAAPSRHRSSAMMHVERFLECYSDIYANRIQLAFGFKAMVVKSRFQRGDFVDALRDDRIQHIAVLSHGYNSRICVNALEDITMLEFLRDTANSKGDLLFHRKSGYFLKHTCGSPKAYSATYAPGGAWEDVERLVRAEEEIRKIERESGVHSPSAIESDSIILREIIGALAMVPDSLHSVPANTDILIGSTTFPRDHISYWERISEPTDFLLWPFHNTDLKDQMPEFLEIKDRLMRALSP